MALEHLLVALRHHLVQHPFETTIVSVLIGFSLYIISNEVARSKARVPSMKGPKGLPIVGNMLDIRRNAAEKCREWAKTYGDVYQVQLGNVPMVIVNSAAAAKTLFSSHSQALTSRPMTYTFHKVALCLPCPPLISIQPRD
jgi:3-hydroxyphenylacetate 6-hydroxylase